VRAISSSEEMAKIEEQIESASKNGEFTISLLEINENIEYFLTYCGYSVRHYNDKMIVSWKK